MSNVDKFGILDERTIVLDGLLLYGFVFAFDPQHCNPELKLFIPLRVEFIDPVL